MKFKKLEKIAAKNYNDTHSEETKMQLNFPNNSILIEYSDRVVQNMTQRHIHNLYELYYLEKGSGIYLIDNQSYEMQSGDVFVIPRGILHKTSYQDMNRIRVAIYFSVSFISLPILQRFGNTAHVFRSEEIADKVKFYINQMKENNTNHQLYFEEQIRLNFQALMLLLLQEGKEIEPMNVAETLGTQMIQYVQEHYMNHLSLNDLAVQFSLSESHLSRVFKKESGFGFNEYLTLVRLQNARKMILEHPEKPISEVAFSCGYSDSNYFSLCFKKNFGIVPHALKK